MKNSFLIETIKASILRDIQEAQSTNFIPTGLATLYLLIEALDRLEVLEQSSQGDHHDPRTHGESQDSRTPASLALSQVAQPPRHSANTHTPQPPAAQSSQTTGTPPLTTEETPSGSIALQQWKQGTCTCEKCTANANTVRPLGQAFPSGETTPGSHEGCDCQLEEVQGTQEQEQAEAVVVQEDTIAQTVPDIWEPPDIDNRIETLHKQEIVTLTWHNFVDGTGCAKWCLPNADESVPTGQAFPSGHKAPPAHPNCNCYLTGTKADGTEVKIPTEEA